MALTIALCDACPSTEVDEMTIALLNIFDSRSLGFVLLEALIEHEVDETGRLSPVALFSILILHRERSRTFAEKLRGNQDAFCICQVERCGISQSDTSKSFRAPCLDLEGPGPRA